MLRMFSAMTTKREAAYWLKREVEEVLRYSPATVFENLRKALAAFDAAPDDEEAGREESETGAQRRARVWSEQETIDENAMTDCNELHEGVTPTILLAIYDTLRALAAAVKERR